jgi:hypothetical protein
MNHREPPHLPVGVRRALRCLSLLLVPTLTLDQGVAGPRLRSAQRLGAEPLPYLPVLGSPTLRIEEAPPPPDLVTRPAAAAPPVPALTRLESSVAAANADAARTVASTRAQTEVTKSATSGTPEATKAPDRAPAPILPDTTRPVIHPEDFLPYFEIPASGSRRPDVTIIAPIPASAPAPAPIPPSSATYTQTPR